MTFFNKKDFIPWYRQAQKDTDHILNLSLFGYFILSSHLCFVSKLTSITFEKQINAPHGFKNDSIQEAEKEKSMRVIELRTPTSV